MKNHIKTLLLLFVLLTVGVHAQALDKEVQIDILTNKITTLVKAGNNAEALPYFEQLEGMQATLPEAFDVMYIDVLDKAGKAEKALERGEAYLKKYGKKGKYYSKVIEVVSRRSMDVEKAAKIKAEKEAREANEAERLAREAERLEANNKAVSLREKAARHAEYGDLENVQRFLDEAAKIVYSSKDSEILKLATFVQPLYAEYGKHFSENYRDNGDGTITDIANKKVWNKCFKGESWSKEKNTCEGSSDYERFSSYSSQNYPKLIDFADTFFCRHDDGTVSKASLVFEGYGADKVGKIICTTGKRFRNRIAFKYTSSIWLGDPTEIHNLLTDYGNKQLEFIWYWDSSRDQATLTLDEHPVYKGISKYKILTVTDEVAKKPPKKKKARKKTVAN